MKYAFINNEKVEASPKLNGWCIGCGEIVISKCGNINIWHWSHKSLQNCDYYNENETYWHRNWKDNFPKENQEIILLKEGVKKIADIKLNKIREINYLFLNFYIELQNSPISSDEIIIRENHYNNMIWIFNGKDYNLCLRKKFCEDFSNYRTFRWKHPKKSLWYCEKPIYIDLGEEIFKIGKLYKNIPCGGYGYLLNKELFIEELKRGKLLK